MVSVSSRDFSRVCGLSFLLILLPIVGSGCKDKQAQSAVDQSGNKSDGNTSTSAANGDSILIGEYGSLTGAQATFGKSSDDGVQLAAERVNSTGGINGKKVSIITEDDQSDASKAETAVKRLIDEKHVIAVLGEVASSNSKAGGKVCEERKIPMISPSSTNIAVTKIGDYIFRVCFIDPYQAAVMARFAHDALKCTRVAIYTNRDQSYSVGFHDDFKAAFTKMGGQIVSEQSYGKDDKDFRGALTAINQASPQAILVPGYYNDAGSIVKQARELGIKYPILGGDGWDSQALFETGGDAVNGCFFSDHMSVDDPSPKVQSFVQDFQKKYGHKPDALAALAFDAAALMFDAMKRGKSLASADIRNAIAVTKNFDGVTGNITINAERNVDKPAVIIAVKDGKFVYDMTINDPNVTLPASATKR